jgi:2-dehydropantoate 2-reductase
MKISVIGAGAIGALVAGYLSDKGLDVTLVGRMYDVSAIKENGLSIEGVRGRICLPVKMSSRLEGGNDLIILAVKTQDIARATYVDCTSVIGDTPILCVQNGVRAEKILLGFLPRDNIISSIVMFGSTYLDRGRILHNFEGGWIIGKAFGPNNGVIDRIAESLKYAFSVSISEEITGMKWLKLFLNLNNCLPALSGKSMQVIFSHPEISRLSIGLLREAITVVDMAKIELKSLPDFPVERLRALATLPVAKAAEIFSATMISLSKEPLYGSILQSIKRGKQSEIDYFNGEIVDLGEQVGVATPLNKSIVNLVHEVEASGRFLRKDEILARIGG